MIIDSHVHLFSRRVVQNVSQKKEMVKSLHLQTENVATGTTSESLKAAMQNAGIFACLLLPTAAMDGVAEANDRSWEKTRETAGLLTAGTLHPQYPNNAGEIERFKKRGITAIKMCSFSQGFALDAAGTLDLFQLIQQENRCREHPFFIVLDTFYEAAVFFGTNPDYTTTPRRLGWVVKQFPGIPFVAAHMGGLLAPFADICAYLPPAANLFLDTSNAAHTLHKNEFIHLLKIHGGEHVIFGTDWPWFNPLSEITKISGCLDEAGFSREEKDAVFSGNIVRLQGCKSEPPGSRIHL